MVKYEVKGHTKGGHWQVWDWIDAKSEADAIKKAKAQKKALLKRIPKGRKSAVRPKIAMVAWKAKKK